MTTMTTAAELVDRLDEIGRRAAESRDAHTRALNRSHLVKAIERFRQGLQKILGEDELSMVPELEAPELELADGTVLRLSRYGDVYDTMLERGRRCDRLATCTNWIEKDIIVRDPEDLVWPIEEGLCHDCKADQPTELERQRLRIRSDLDVIDARTKETPYAAMVVLARAVLHMASVLEGRGNAL